MRFALLLFLCFSSFISLAQPDRWQQRVKYVMQIDVDTSSNRFKGKQRLEYSNNSPEKLDKVFYHLYWNAFQPNSSMDVRSRELGKIQVNNRPDWDGRVKDRILNLNENEIGYQKILSLKMNGIPQPFFYHETILEVKLTAPIPAKAKVVFDMEFEAQIPLQVRRSGRDNPQTGVRYSMTQWYPKLCEYDQQGWHPTPYVAREFYGVWGDFDVNISIAANYKIGGTGVLFNSKEIGWGYDSLSSPLKVTSAAKRTWKFKAENVHDFAWAADPDYNHIVRRVAGGPVIHVIYNRKQDSPGQDSAWQKMADAAVAVLPFIEKNFGKYAYPQYTFIQGGDGGMEYPMTTLISGASLGTAFHEWMHSWYQMMLATNESLYAWMDEGFTSYAENLVTGFYNKRSSLEDYRDALKEQPSNDRLKQLMLSLPEMHSDSYAGYFSLVKSGLEEPMTTHADHYNTNYAYATDAYSKGAVFLEQLGYIVGAAARDRILLQYYKSWRFKHPDANDFIRIAEKETGMKLDWYREYWVNTTKTINYSIDSLWEENDVTKIRLRRIGNMPMPVDLLLQEKNGSNELHYIPLNLMFGSKASEDPSMKWIGEEAWRWTHPTYIVETKIRLADIKRIELDPSKRMADVERKNNLLELTW